MGSYLSNFTPGFVYVMESEGLYKIGYSGQPGRRLMGVQSTSPHPVRLVGCIEGSMEAEAEWHRFFRDKRVRGEWFELTPDDVTSS